MRLHQRIFRNIIGAEFCNIPYSSCNLGSINLTKCLDISGKNFDFDKFNKLIQIAVRFLDDMITVNKLPLQKITEITNLIRPIGLGIMGLADVMYALGIPYNSEAGARFVRILLTNLLEYANEISTDIAQEKGSFPNYENSTFFVFENDVLQRNSSLLSFAPNGSISFIANITGSIEPCFALTYTRRTNDGHEYTVVNEIFENELKKRGIYSEDLIASVKNNHGSCQGIDEIPKDMQKVFVTAHDLTPNEHLEMLALAQEFVDLSISKTINLPNLATINDVKDVYFSAWEKQCKGVTIYRDGSRANQTLSAGGLEDEVTETENCINGRGIILEASDDLIGRKRKIITGCGSLHTMAYFDPADGNMLEVYLSKGSAGGCLSFMNGLSRTISLALRGGVSLESIIDQLNSVTACPSYVVRTKTKNDTSPGNCCPAAVAKALLEMQQEINEHLTDEEIEYGLIKLAEVDDCPDCGSLLVHENSCVVCKSCGYSKCG